MPEDSSRRRRPRSSAKQARATLKPTQTSAKSPAAKSEIVAGSDVTPSVTHISPEREYAFIREDLRRLLITAAILIAVMIGLLVIIDQ
jgi:hypothetical protein